MTLILLQDNDAVFKYASRLTDLAQNNRCCSRTHLDKVKTGVEEMHNVLQPGIGSQVDTINLEVLILEAWKQVEAWRAKG